MLGLSFISGMRGRQSGFFPEQSVNNLGRTNSNDKPILLSGDLDEDEHNVKLIRNEEGDLVPTGQLNAGREDHVDMLFLLEG